MRTIGTMCLLLIALPTMAGTLRDNFDDGNFDGWALHNVGGVALDDSHWAVENGVLIGERHNGWALQLVVGEKEWTDYTVKCDIRLIEIFPTNPVNNGAGIIVRRMDNDNVLGFDSYMLPTPSIWGWVWKNRNFVHDTQKPFPLQVGQWYEFKVDASGNDMDFFIEGELAMEVRNTWLPSGLVGINLAGAKAEYDNFSVTGADIPNMNMSLAVESVDKLTTTWAQIKGR